MSLPTSASDTVRRKAQRVLYADRMVQETALAYGLRNSIAWEGEPGKRGGTNRIFGEYGAGMLETTDAERTSYIASVPPTVAPSTPTNLQVLVYYQKLIVLFDRPTNVLPESNITYTVTVNPGNISASGTSSPIIVSGITNGTTYSVSVVASNAAGASPAATLGSVDSSYSPTVFTTTDTWTAPTYITSVEYLVVGGGGGGGNGYDTGGGGGGGAGMVLTGVTTVVPGTAYTVTVGSGGAGGGATRTNIPGSSGLPSEFNSIVALGGNGGGGSRTQAQTPGGYGAGGTAQNSAIASARGGNGGGSNGAGGGGGGSSSNGTTRPNNSTGGTGGTGVSSSISGSAITYGVGGNGANANTLITGAAGTANRGNGGGAGSAGSGAAGAGGSGGSGIVILRF